MSVHVRPGFGPRFRFRSGCEAALVSVLSPGRVQEGLYKLVFYGEASAQNHVSGLLHSRSAISDFL